MSPPALELPDQASSVVYPIAPHTGLGKGHFLSYRLTEMQFTHLTIHSFKVYSPMAFIILMELCHHHHNQF